MAHLEEGHFLVLGEGGVRTLARVVCALYSSVRQCHNHRLIYIHRSSINMLIIILTLGNSACVLLEGEAEDGDLLVGDRVEEALHDALGEAQSVVMMRMTMIFIRGHQLLWH